MGMGMGMGMAKCPFLTSSLVTLERRRILRNWAWDWEWEPARMSRSCLGLCACDTRIAFMCPTVCLKLYYVYATYSSARIVNMTEAEK